MALEVSSPVLLALDRLEEGLEVALAEAASAVPLDDLEEYGRTVSDRLREDLQQVALVVAVDEDAEPLQVLDVLVDLPDARRHLVVVLTGDREELDTALPQGGYASHDVPGGERDVLRARAVVELDVLVDLRLALALGGLVDRELDPAAAVGDNLRHQRRVLGRDRLVREMDHLRHPEDALVVVDPLLHVAELDVADDVVDRHQQQLAGIVRGDLGAPLEAGQEGAG